MPERLRQIGTTWLPALLVVLGSLRLCGGVLRVLPTLPTQDFAQYYFALDHVHHDGSLYDPTPVRGGINWHPPHFHLVVWPFYALGSLQRAYLGWMAFSGVCLAATLITLLRRRRRWWWAAFAVWGAPLTVVLNGQTVLVLLVPLALAYLAARRGHAGWTGVWLGTVIIVKPFLAPLLWWPLIRRQWRTLGMTGLSALAWLFLGVVVFGWGELVRWTQQLHREIPWADHYLNTSIAALVAHGVHPATLISWRVLAAGFLLITSVRVLIESNQDRAWLLLVLAGLLASPLAWIYYWWWIVPMVIALSDEHWRPWQIVLLAAWLWPLAWAPRVPGFYAFALVLTWLLLLLEGTRCHSGSRNRPTTDEPRRLMGFTKPLRSRMVGTRS